MKLIMRATKSALCAPAVAKPTFNSFQLEPLEDRRLLNAVIFTGADAKALLQEAQAEARMKSVIAQPNFTVEKASTVSGDDSGSPLPAGFSPQQIRTAYGFYEAIVTRHGKQYVASGFGETIAIIDAYSDPNITSDAEMFDSTFGLSNDTTGSTPFLQIAQPDGTAPTTNRNASNIAGWAGETSLDVEWAHAMAPRATILLVEAYDDSLNSLISAIQYATSVNGVVAVSMSWGSAEFPYETQLDQYLTTPAGHKGGYGLDGGIVFTSSAGDDGSGSSWPAASPNVVAVGGTDLYTTADGTYMHEVAWNGSGGGYSEIEDTNDPDVAYDADPDTGFAVYDSVPFEGQSGWAEYGGTSAGAPQWAALFADADQGRYYEDRGSIDGPSQALPYIDDDGVSNDPIARNYFHEITSGSNGGYTAHAGYNLITGWGTPKAQKIIPALLKIP
jgi:subtilase family serine protease